MKKNEKFLALLLSVVMILTCFVGTVTVSAEDATTPTATIVIKADDVEAGAKQIPVTFTVTSTLGINEALIKVSSNLGNIIAQPTVVADCPADIDNAGNATDYNSFFLSAKSPEGQPETVMGEIKTATISAVFTNEAGLVAGETYTVDVEIPEGKVIAASKDEVAIKLECTKYEFTVEEVAACDHANAAKEVTTQPTKDAEGVMTYTCECGETWTAPIAVAEVIDGEDIRFNISLNSSIDVGFTVANTYTQNSDIIDYYAVVTKRLYVNENVYGDPVVDTFGKDKFVKHNASRDKFIYSGITAKDMGNNINVIVYFQYCDNTFKYIELNFELTDYVDAVISSYGNTFETNAKNRKLITLLCNMLVYGDYAQINFKYNTGNLATAGYETYVDKYATSEAIDYNNAYSTESIENPTHTMLATLALESSITIRSEIRLANNTKITSVDQLEGYYAQIVIDGDVNNPIRADISDFYCNGQRTYAEYSGFTTREKSRTATFALYDASGKQVSNSVTYSIETYAALLVESGVAENNISRLLNDSMIRFLCAAEAYFA